MRADTVINSLNLASLGKNVNNLTPPIFQQQGKIKLWVSKGAKRPWLGVSKWGSTPLCRKAVKCPQRFNISG